MFDNITKGDITGVDRKVIVAHFHRSTHTLTLFVQFGFFLFLHNILIWPAVSRHLSTLTVSEIGKFSLESLRNIEVVLSLSLRGLTVICETKQNEKVLFMRLTQICAVRSELRDVTLKRAFILSKRGKLYI